MFSRRDLLLRASASTGWLALSGVQLFAASDFWNKKDPAEWSEQEKETLKTKSPWAKKIHGEGNFGGRGGGRGGSMDSSGSKGSFGGMSGADSNGISTGGGGGRRGGGGGGDMGAAAPAPQGPEVVIRWESATPMLAATKFQLPPALADHYAISITGLPPQLLAMVLSGRGGRGGGRGRGRDGTADAAPPPDAETQPPADPAAEAKARQDRLLHAATLSAKNKDPQTADTVLQTADKRTIIFGFLKANLPIAPTDKDLEFALKFGPTTFKAKFEPKEMMYQGALTV
jgi:hypothetical protein